MDPLSPRFFDNLIATSARLLLVFSFPDVRKAASFVDAVDEVKDSHNGADAAQKRGEPVALVSFMSPALVKRNAVAIIKIAKRFGGFPGVDAAPMKFKWLKKSTVSNKSDAVQRQAWMRAYEQAMKSRGGKIDWDTAHHLYVKQTDPNEAAARSKMESASLYNRIVENG